MLARVNLFEAISDNAQDKLPSAKIKNARTLRANF